MDFLDSLEECGRKRKRSRRVRSWYLYEQYKALEKNQSDAAQRLKHKTCQDRILHQELWERRARRSLRTRVGAPLPDMDSVISAPTSLTNDTYYDVFDTTMSHDRFDLYSEPLSLIQHEDLKPVETCLDDCSECCKKVNKLKARKQQKLKASILKSPPNENSDIANEAEEDDNYVDKENYIAVRNNNAVVQTVNVDKVFKLRSERNLADDLKEELESVKKDIAETISWQLSTEKDKLHCLERFSRLCSHDSLPATSEEEMCDQAASACSLQPEISAAGADDGSICAFWTRLVSFAYQVIQLNHGNCYYDYSSQFMTAVLACDIICRGVNRMCEHSPLFSTNQAWTGVIKNPYVSPIATEIHNTSSEEGINQKSYVNKKKIITKRKKSPNRRKPQKKQTHSLGDRYIPSTIINYKQKYNSESNWVKSIENRQVAVTGNPLQAPSPSRMPSIDKSFDSFWLDDFKSKYSSEDYFSQPVSQITNPMLKLEDHLDRLITKVEDFDKRN